MSWRAALLALAVYGAVALVITFPLILQLSSAVPHDRGDPLLSTSILWWNAHVLPFTERWWNGMAFYPAPGMLSFSDHRLGASLIASPIQWFGGTDVAAYNLTLLATFPLSALAAHALGFTLTGRHDAAAVCGLAYGFNPYRIAHIEHLELLAAYGMPVALMALHRYARTRRPVWIGLFSAALVLQGLSTSYFLVFFCVLLALWSLWFVSWRDWRALAAVGAGCVAAAAVLSPIILGYLRIHASYGMARPLREVLEYSAEFSSFVAASPLLKWWGWTSTLAPPERQLFPGLAVTLVALAGALTAVYQSAGRPTPKSLLLPAVLAAAGVIALAMAVSVRWIGDWSIGPLRVSQDVFKPQSVALACLTLSVATLPAMRAAFGRRSPLAFYLVACAFLFVCSLGPQPTYAGAQMLYEPPYAWLMRLPVFGTGIRAPARFAMPAVLALSSAAALAFARLTAARSTSAQMAAAAVCAGIVADTWTGGLPMLRLRSTWSPGWAAEASAVLELPLGGIDADVAAMHRATRHARPTVNGYSGFTPPHYVVLKRALEEGDSTVLEEVSAATGPLLVAIDRRADSDLRLRNLTASVEGATELGLEGRWQFWRLPGSDRSHTRTDLPANGRASHGCTNPVRIGAIAEGEREGRSGEAATSAAGGPLLPQPSAATLVNLFDGNPATGWISASPQRAGDQLTITLATDSHTCGVALSLGSGPEVYPGALAIEVSTDGTNWQTMFNGRTAGRVMAAALRDPVHSPIAFEWAPTATRFLKLHLVESHTRYPWAMREIAVAGR